MLRQSCTVAEWFAVPTLCKFERRARFSVGVGCPSFGGQRTVRGGSDRLLANVVTISSPMRPGKLLAGLRQRSSSAYFARICHASVAEFGRRVQVRFTRQA